MLHTDEQRALHEKRGSTMAVLGLGRTTGGYGRGHGSAVMKSQREEAKGLRIHQHVLCCVVKASEL